MSFHDAESAIPASRCDKVNEILQIASKAVCKIRTTDQECENGLLIHISDKTSNKRFLIGTCHHVLPTNSINDIIQTEFLFENISLMANTTIPSEHVKFVWTSNSLEATLIEISPELAARFTTFGARFLEVGAAVPNNDVVFLQYSRDKINISVKYVESVEESKVFYKIGTECRISGSPLLNWDCVALAMHNAIKGTTSIKPIAICEATALHAIVEAYLEERPHYENSFTSDSSNLTKQAISEPLDYCSEGMFLLYN